MKVLLLGGTGVFGKSAAALLACQDLVTEIGIASRHLETAQQVATEIGDKAHALRIDIKDLPQLAAIAAGYDLIVNAAGPTSQVQVPAIQAAIEARVDYCDLAAIGTCAGSALQLDPQARARNITAIIATGWIAVLNQLAVHAARQLDQAENLSVCMLFDYSPGSYFSPERSLARARETGRVETSWDLIETAGGPILAYRDGEWIHVDPLENPVEIIHPAGSKVTAYLADSPSTLTLPRCLPGVKTVTCLLGLVPPQLMGLFIQKSRRVARGETDFSGAAIDFFETAVADKDRWLVSPAGYPSGWGMWVGAEGWRNGRRGRYLCWPSMILDWTTVPLIIVALRILRGEVSLHGVLPPEACLEPGLFFEQAARHVRGEQRGKTLLNERFDWLE
jgi:saccharopine dehydrogenase-like NADP-dependent oxidoreductase